MDDYREERLIKADKAFRQIRLQDVPDNQMLTLPYCIELALKNNLDLKVYELKEAVSKERKTAEVLGMLPDLVITSDLTSRGNQPGAKSESLLDGTQSLQYSKSTQPTEERVRVELIFSIVDFGLAYLKSAQQEDRVMLSGEQKRRAMQNLILDVTQAYFKVAAAQFAMVEIERILKICNNTEAILEEISRKKKISVFKVIEEQKKFLFLKKRLREYRRSYDNSCIELRSLMGCYPVSRITVDVSVMDELETLKSPEVDLLERIALIERPELYQIDIQRHVTILEARKTIVMMFPNVRAFVDFTGSSNKYLYHKTWWEIGARAAYHLMRLPQQIEHYMALDKETDQLEAQTLALSVGVIAQVRIAHANFFEVQERYKLAEQISRIHQRHLEVARNMSKTTGSLSKIELRQIEMEAAGAKIDATQAMANYYLAYYRLLNSVGLQDFHEDTIVKIEEKIKKAEEEVDKEIKEAEKELPKEEREAEQKLIEKAKEEEKELTEIKALEKETKGSSKEEVKVEQKLMGKAKEAEKELAKIKALEEEAEEKILEKVMKNPVTKLEKAFLKSKQVETKKSTFPLKSDEGNIPKSDNLDNKLPHAPSLDKLDIDKEYLPLTGKNIREAITKAAVLDASKGTIPAPLSGKIGNITGETLIDNDRDLIGNQNFNEELLKRNDAIERIVQEGENLDSRQPGRAGF